MGMAAPAWLGPGRRWPPVRVGPGVDRPAPDGQQAASCDGASIESGCAVVSRRPIAAVPRELGEPGDAPASGPPRADSSSLDAARIGTPRASEGSADASRPRRRAMRLSTESASPQGLSVSSAANQSRWWKCTAEPMACNEEQHRPQDTYGGSPSGVTEGATRPTTRVSLPRFGLSRTLRESRSEEDTAPEEVEVGAAVHLSLHELQARDLALRLRVAPGRRQGSAKRIAVLRETGREGLD